LICMNISVIPSHSKPNRLYLIPRILNIAKV
jgi:hypothetical protein